MSTASSQTNESAAAQHAALGMRPEGQVSTKPTHPEAQWFGGGELGLMIHWGIASGHGELELSWGMVAETPWDRSWAPANKITPHDYWKLADRFVPDRWNPDEWVAAAAKAGFRYAVFVAMHHDGYTMWPSAASPFGVHTTPGGRDLLAPYVEACRRHGLKVGIYLSPPDWHFDREVMSFHYQSMGGLEGFRKIADSPVYDQNHHLAEISAPSPEHLAARRKLFHARIREVLKGYGRVDLLWFDGGTWDNEARDLALSLQPHLVINSRSCAGHFESTECSFPEKNPGTWLETVFCWQTCPHTMPDGRPVEVWGYLETETYKPAAWVADHYRQLREWGCNLCVNVSPRPNGEMPPIVMQRLRELEALRP